MGKPNCSVGVGEKTKFLGTSGEEGGNLELPRQWVQNEDPQEIRLEKTRPPKCKKKNSHVCKLMAPWG